VIPQPLVLDHTALVALFEGSTDAFGLWSEADRAERLVVMPAAAIAEANHLIGADHNAWSALLFPADVTVAPLDSSQAIDIGPFPGALVTRHVVHEARAIGGTIVTRAPWQYADGDGPLRAI
jgi:hypothetical protein